MLRKRVLAGIAVHFMVGCAVFTLSAFAHDIDVEQARQKVEDYVRTVLKERGYLADAADTISCNKLYPHQVLCEISYSTKEDRRRGSSSCRESITVYFKSHSGSKRDWNYYMSHRDATKCGGKYLTGPRP